MSRISASPLITLTTSSSNIDRLREAEAAQMTAMTGPASRGPPTRLDNGRRSTDSPRRRRSRTIRSNGGARCPTSPNRGERPRRSLRSRLARQRTRRSSEQDTLPVDQRDALAAEVDALLGQPINVANSITPVDMFAGSAYDGLAFDEDGTYVGSDDALRPGRSKPVDRNRLHRRRLRQRHQRVVRACRCGRRPDSPAAATAAFLDTLDDALHDITSVRTTVGPTMQRAEDALTASESLQPPRAATGANGGRRSRGSIHATRRDTSSL